MKNTTEAGLPSVTFPSDDGSIELALTDVESKVAAWCNAVAEAQHALAKMAASVAEQETTIEADVPSISEPQEELGPHEELEPQEEPEPQEELDLEQENLDLQQETPDLEQEKLELGEEPAVEEQPECHEDDAQAEIAAEQSEPETEQAAPSDDEALLASLDEETANAIRVMQRLTPSKKTVQELLEIHRSLPPGATGNQSKTKSPSKRGSLWGRRKKKT